MDAVKYLEERKRMCGSYNNMCAGCGFGKVPQCNDAEDYNTEEAVAIVEKMVSRTSGEDTAERVFEAVPECRCAK